MATKTTKSHEKSYVSVHRFKVQSSGFGGAGFRGSRFKDYNCLILIKIRNTDIPQGVQGPGFKGLMVTSV